MMIYGNCLSCESGEGLQKPQHGRRRRISRRRFLLHLAVGVIVISPVGTVIADASNAAPIKSGTAFERIHETTLDLVLTGIVRGKTNIAVIRVGGARDKVLPIGEAITQDVTLVALDSFGAVISNHGTLERLPLSHEGGSKPSAPSAPIADAQVAAPAVRQAGVFRSGRIVASVPAGAVRNLGNGRFVVKRSFVTDQLLSGDLFANANLEPDTAGTFHLTEIVPGSLYDAVGLRDGDAISAINGKPFKALDDLESLLYEQRYTVKAMQVDVLRGGAVTNLRFQFE